MNEMGMMTYGDFARLFAALRKAPDHKAPKDLGSLAEMLGVAMYAGDRSVNGQGRDFAADACRLPKASNIIVNDDPMGILPSVKNGAALEKCTKIVAPNVSEHELSAWLKDQLGDYPAGWPTAHNYRVFLNALRQKIKGRQPWIEVKARTLTKEEYDEEVGRAGSYHWYTRSGGKSTPFFPVADAYLVMIFDPEGQVYKSILVPIQQVLDRLLNKSGWDYKVRIDLSSETAINVTNDAREALENTTEFAWSYVAEHSIRGNSG